MKEFFKKLLTNFGMVLIMAFLVPAWVNHNWQPFIAVMQIFLVVLVIHLGQLLTNRFSSQYRFLELGLEFLMVLTVVLVFGGLFNWYTLELIWIMPAMVVPVYIGAYILDITRTRREVEAINIQIQRRKERLMNASTREKDQ
ncbi:MAG TPA: DUF3021 family protein [Anaerolineaceae bacterium]|nr:DUF3021 family protein [Anaerolineaceae bacterium]HPN54174.1 DUF3021 family protein [Anaerolineaceae bacterium]